MEFDVSFWFGVGAALYGASSEIIGMNDKWKSNTNIQLIMMVLKKVFKK